MAIGFVAHQSNETANNTQQQHEHSPPQKRHHFEQKKRRRAWLAPFKHNSSSTKHQHSEPPCASDRGDYLWLSFGKQLMLTLFASQHYLVMGTSIAYGSYLITENQQDPHQQQKQHQHQQLISTASPENGVNASQVHMNAYKMATNWSEHSPAGEMSRLPALSDTQFQMIASVYYIGQLVGSLVSGPLNSRLSAKQITMLAMPLGLVGRVLLVLPSSSVKTAVTTQLSGRVMEGMHTGLICAPMLNLIAEVIRSEWRGLMLALAVLFVPLGQLIAYCGMAGGYDWRRVTLVTGVTPLLLQMCLLPFPDSDKWLLARGRCEKHARRSLKFYNHRRTSEQCQRQIDTVKRSLKQLPGTTVQPTNAHTRPSATPSSIKQPPPTLPQQDNTPEINTAAKQDKSGRAASLLSREHLYPVLLMIGQFVLLSNGGSISTMAYISVILNQSTEHGHTGRYAGVLLVTSVRLLGGVLSIVLVRRLRRLLLLSAAAMVSGCACLVFAATSHWSLDQHPGYEWLPTVALLCQAFSFTVGLSPITWTLQTELLPNAVRAQASALCLTMYYMLSFIAVYIYQPLVAMFGQTVVYTVFAAVNFVHVLYAAGCLVETRGRSLEQIEQQMSVRTPGRRSKMMPPPEVDSKIAPDETNKPESDSKTPGDGLFAIVDETKKTQVS